MLPPELVQRVAVCIERGDDFVSFLHAMSNTRLTLPLLVLQTLAMTRSPDDVWPEPNLEVLPCPPLVPYLVALTSRVRLAESRQLQSWRLPSLPWVSHPLTTLSVTIEGACSAARMAILPSLCAVIAQTPSLRTLDVVFARRSDLYRPSATQLVDAIAASCILSLSLVAHEFFKLPSNSARVLGQYLLRAPMTHVRLVKIAFVANGLLSWLIQHLLMSPSLVHLAVLDSPVVASVVPPGRLGRHLQRISLSAVPLSDLNGLTQRLADSTHLTSLSLHVDASSTNVPNGQPNGDATDYLIYNVLPQMHRLVELSLRHCVVSPLAVHALAQAVLPHLDVLELDTNGLYGHGCLALASYLPNARHLFKLALRNQGCTDTCVAALVTALQRMPALTALDLSGNAIGPTGAARLAHIAPQLTKWTMSDNPLTLAGVEALLCGWLHPSIRNCTK
ncbi:hypothetical protein SPRG_04316, partial [Saprolegnia parasitica CBS 223.65]